MTCRPPRSAVCARLESAQARPSRFRSWSSSKLPYHTRSYAAAFQPSSGLRHLGNLEIAPCPAHVHHGALLWRLPVEKGEARTGALQQCFRDKEAQPKPTLLGLARRPAAARHIGLADPAHDLRRKARPVIRNRDGYVLLAPAYRDFDARLREIDRVLDQIAEPAQDGG